MQQSFGDFNNNTSPGKSKLLQVMLPFFRQDSILSLELDRWHINAYLKVFKKFDRGFKRTVFKILLELSSPKVRPTYRLFEYPITDFNNFKHRSVMTEQTLPPVSHTPQPCASVHCCSVVKFIAGFFTHCHQAWMQGRTQGLLRTPLWDTHSKRGFLAIACVPYVR